jgi:hypothetical protein
MGTIVNLNRYRKDRQRAERERRANEKRALFGIPKHERTKSAAQRTLDSHRLDNARRDGHNPERED